MNAPLALAAGDYTARIDAVGASLVGLDHRGRPLLYDVTEAGGVPTPAYRGMMLVPWPNRIRDGRYTFAGRLHQLAVNEVERATALHGLTLWNTWVIESHENAQVGLSCTVAPRPGYPFELRVHVRFALDAKDGLGIELTTTNTGKAAAPYGASFHPYFRAGTGDLDTWTLRLPTRAVITVDERLLPTGRVPVAGSRFDFTEAASLAGQSLDHAFADVSSDSTGHAAAELRAADGSGVRIGWDGGCGWVQVYTLDQPGQAMHRGAVAIEPMTCAPDAFNTGDGLITLEPGTSHVTRWQVSRISPLG